MMSSPTLLDEKSVQQGCFLSPLLFNIYEDYIMRRALEKWDGGVKIGKRINNLRYADDITLLTASETELAELAE